MAKSLLLINPWIYDFAAFDLWSKPLGLLYLGSFLRSQGFFVKYIDCLTQKKRADVDSKFGRGPFRREIIEKPALLNHIPRKYARYGISEEDFITQLKNAGRVDAVLLTSIMTYWYPGVQRVAELVRHYLPGVPLLLGGVYASIMPEHARQAIQPDFLVAGPGEEQTLKLLQDILEVPAVQPVNTDLDAFPYPAFDLLPNPSYLIMMTSRGCPYDCSFCAQKSISRTYGRRSVQAVLDEFEYHYKEYKIRDFAFYDDALFIARDKHIIPILEGLIERRLPLRLHAPNGLFARYVDEKLANRMYQAGFKTIRLSFETSNEERRDDMGTKVTNQDMIAAVQHLRTAGFKSSDLQAYVLMGLPGQALQEVLDSIFFIHGLGVQTSLASYSPIPGTKEFERAVSAGLINRDIDPLLLNNSIYPLQQSSDDYETYRQVRVTAQVLNQAAQRGVSLFSSAHIGQAMRQVVNNLK